MASLSDPAQGYIDTARRDRSLLQRAYTAARRKRDYLGAMEIAKMGDSRGFNLGKAVPDEAVRGAGMDDYRTAMKARKMEPESSWTLDRFDFRQRRERMPYPKTMGAADVIAENPEAFAPKTQGAMPYSDIGAETVGSPAYEDEVRTPKFDRSIGWRQRWMNAPTQDEKDFVVEEASRAGVPMNPDVALPILQRRSAALLPRPRLDASYLPSSGTQPQDLPELPGQKTGAPVQNSSIAALMKRKRMPIPLTRSNG